MIDSRRKPEAQRTVKKISSSSGPRWNMVRGHPADHVLIHRFVTGDFNLSANATHKLILLLAPFSPLFLAPLFVYPAARQ